MALLSGSSAKISEVGRHTRRCIKEKAAGMLNVKSGNHTVFLDLAYKHCHLTLKPVSARRSFPKIDSRTPASLPSRICASCKSLGWSASTRLTTASSAKLSGRDSCLCCGHIENNSNVLNNESDFSLGSVPGVTLEACNS